ncbi:MAG TPA: hypothetical protein VE621_05205 [Bryobacteraceae bacterium]|jgi:hypothetical protein|nr:hypothetical protein [Bryobacteraceae bacterium]
MNPRIVIIGLIALAIVGAFVGAGLFVTKDNRLKLTGKVLQVRSYAISPETSIAVIDLSLKNPSTQQFQLGETAVELVKRDGSTVPGEIASNAEADRFFQYYPVLGKRYNPSLVRKTILNSGAGRDYMLSVRFDVPDSEIQNRKGVRIKLVDVDGVGSEITEQR